MDIILKYFPGLGMEQAERFAALGQLYEEWNAKINVISRKDMEEFYLRHVLHSLSIAKVCGFDAGARVLDVGTGGGFPGIPLAIMFPEVRFTLADSIGKKIKVVADVAARLGLDNVEAINGRAEQIPGRFDYVVSRAVTDMATFLGWIWSKVDCGQKGSLPNGILYLKGGDLREELLKTGKDYKLFDIPGYFPEDFFETKKVVYIER